MFEGFIEERVEGAGVTLFVRRAGPPDAHPVVLLRLDGMWAHGVKLWDVAAGLLIAQESGALISNFNGDPKYLESDHFVCSTPKVYKSILKSVKPYFKD